MRRLAILGLVFVAAILSCGKDVTGPLSAAGRFVRGLSWEPIFPAAFQAAGGAGSGLVQATAFEGRIGDEVLDADQRADEPQPVSPLAG